MNVLIVEDEKIAAERLQLLLAEYSREIVVTGITESIEETVQFLRTRPHPSLILLDIHLSDGHSFEIFKQVSYSGPILFTTAYDQYALDAFKLLSIDYILKPVTLETLAAGIQKVNSLTQACQHADVSQLPLQRKSVYKRRFLGKVGQRLFFIDAGDISYFQADNKIVHMVDNKSNRYLVDFTLEKLETLLDPQHFFRLNRRYIVGLHGILQVKPYYNHRLKLSMKGGPAEEDGMVISRERVQEFKLWAESGI